MWVKALLIHEYHKRYADGTNILERRALVITHLTCNGA